MPKESKEIILSKRKQRLEIMAAADDTGEGSLYEAPDSMLKRFHGEPLDAYEAFLDYVELGAQRSIRMQCRVYDQISAEGSPVPSLQPKTLHKWRIDYHWEQRIANYLEAFQLKQLQVHEEEYARMSQKVWAAFNGIMDEGLAMLQEFSRYREVASEEFVREVEDVETGETLIEKTVIVTRAINVDDLKSLQKTMGSAGKDLRKSLGLPDVVEVKMAGQQPAVGQNRPGGRRISISTEKAFFKPEEDNVVQGKLTDINPKQVSDGS